MTDVFISYSRRDKAFVQMLHTALVEAKRDTWVDWEDIPLTADWWEEIKAGIEAADAFIFVITPDSVASAVCQREVEYAVQCQKRLVPVLRQEVDATLLHEELRARNWIYFRDTHDFAKTFGSLIQTLDADLDFVKTHTRLLVRAKEWDAQTRNTSYALRGADLQTAESWLAGSLGKQPEPTQLHFQYIGASRQAATARQRVTIGGLTFGIVVALVLAVFAVNRAQIATEEANNRATQQAIAVEEANNRATAQVIAQQNESTAVAAEGTAERSADEALSQALAASAQLARNENNTELAVALALEANSIPNPPAQAQRTLAEAAYSPGERRAWKAHEEGITSMALSPDGTMLASSGCAAQQNFFCRQGEIRLWDVTTGDFIRSIGSFSGDVKKVVFSPNGRSVLSGSCGDTGFEMDCTQGEVILWNTVTGAEIQRFEGLQGYIYDVTLSADGQFVAAGSRAGLAVWDTLSGSERFRKSGTLGQPVWSVAFSPDGKQVAAGDALAIMIWDSQSGEEIHRLIADSGIDIKSVAFSPDGQTLLTGSATNVVTLWNVKDGTPIRNLIGHLDEVNSVAFSPDGQRVVTTGSGLNSSDRSIIVWEVQSGALLYRFQGHIGFGDDRSTYLSSGPIGAVFSRDGRRVFSCGGDKTIRVWDIENGAAIRRLQVSQPATALSPDGRWLASGGAQSTSIDVQNSLETGTMPSIPEAIGAITLWDAATGDALLQFKGHSSEVMSLAFSPDERYLLSGGADKMVMLWNSGTGEIVQRMEGHAAPVHFVVYSPDGHYAVSSDFDTTDVEHTSSQIIVWNLDSGQIALHFPQVANFVGGLAFSPDGQQVYSLMNSGPNSEILIWERETGEISKRVPIPQGAGRMAISRDGQQALLSNQSGLRLWNMETGEMIGRPLVGHETNTSGGISPILSVAFSPDGQYGLSGGADSTVILWDINSGEAIRRFRGHTNWVESVGFSPDGRTAVSGSVDNSLILWRIDTLPELVNWTFANRSVREVTCNERIQYHLTAACDRAGFFATRTPYPSLTPSATFTSSPTVDLTRTTATPTLTTTPTATSSPTLTPSATATIETTKVSDVMQPIPIDELASRVAKIEIDFQAILPREIPDELNVFRIADYQETESSGFIPPGKGFSIVFGTDEILLRSNPQRYIFLVEMPSPFADVHEWAEGTGVAPLIAFTRINGVEVAIMPAIDKKSQTVVIYGGTFLLFLTDNVDFNLKDRLIKAMLPE